MRVALRDFGRARWTTRNLPGLKAQFPSPAGNLYIFLGLYYLLKDAVLEFGNSFFPLFELANAMSSCPLSSRGCVGPDRFFPSFSMAGMSEDNFDDVSAFIDKCARAYGFIKIRFCEAERGLLPGEFSFESLQGTWNWNGRMWKAVLNYLIAQYKIELSPGKENVYRIVDMNVSIPEAYNKHKQTLANARTLHELFKAGEDLLGSLWHVPTLYLYDRETNTLRLTGRKKGGITDCPSKGFSPYKSWAEPRFLYEKLIDDYINDGTLVQVIELDKAIAEKSHFIDFASVSKDYENFMLDTGRPGALVAGIIIYVSEVDHKEYKDGKIDKQELRRRSLRGVFSASNRILKADAVNVALAKETPALRYRPPISPNQELNDVKGTLRDLILKPFGKKIFYLTDSFSPKDVWDMEAQAIERRAATPPKGLVQITVDEVGERLGAEELTQEEKQAVFDLGDKKIIQGATVSLIESPSEKIYRKTTAVIEWFRNVILSVYEGTSITKGKSRNERIEALSLQDELMNERVIRSRFTALIGDSNHDELNLLGIISFNVLDVEVNGKKIEVLKVPEAMIRREARGKKLQVALTYEIGKRQLRKLLVNSGLIKGFWLVLTKGVPIYATTQSKRVIKDLSRLKDLSVLRLAKGKGLTEEQKIIIKTCSKSAADDAGIERGIYGGPIAINEEEKNIIIINERINQKVDGLLQEAGTKGRIHVIGYLTVGVGIKTAFELFFSRLFKSKKR